MKLLDQILHLPNQEKIVLVNQILDSMTDENADITIPEDVKNMVAERLERYNANPSLGLSLEEFKTQFRKRISKLK